MSEPARVLPTLEDDTDAVPDSLREWLDALRRYETDEPERPSARRPEPARRAPAADNAPWGPRLVQADPVPEPSEETDISELLAENLMLKAKLKVEHDRQDALQSALAEQIRELREHIAGEMESLEELRIELEEARAKDREFRVERDHLLRDLDQAATERDAAFAERDSAQQDRDLWRARAEALAQPLFQSARA